MWWENRRAGGPAGRRAVRRTVGLADWRAEHCRPLPDAEGDIRCAGHGPPARLPARPPGFTLIEILVVIAVIAILASIVTPMVFRNVGDAKVSAAKTQVEILATALDAYRLDNDYYPSTAQGLAALRTRPEGEPAALNWRGPYLRKDVPPDPWGRPYVYQSPGSVNPESYDLKSLGRDGQPGGEGEDADVTSWSR